MQVSEPILKKRQISGLLSRRVKTYITSNVDNQP